MMTTTSSPQDATNSSIITHGTTTLDPRSTQDQGSNTPSVPTTSTEDSGSDLVPITTFSPDNATSSSTNQDDTSLQDPGSTHNQGSKTTTVSITSTEDSVASTSSRILDITPYAVGGAVGGLVVVIVVVIVIVIVLLFVKRNRQKSPDKVNSNKNVGLLSYNNALYDSGKETDSCNAHTSICIVLDISIQVYCMVSVCCSYNIIIVKQHLTLTCTLT